jgi:hypothetical protein
VTVDGEGRGLARRVSEALARRPALADHPIKVSEHDGIVTLAGRAPTIEEALIAFRAAQQTPSSARSTTASNSASPTGSASTRSG